MFFISSTTGCIDELLKYLSESFFYLDPLGRKLYKNLTETLSEEFIASFKIEDIGKNRLYRLQNLLSNSLRNLLLYNSTPIKKIYELAEKNAHELDKLRDNTRKYLYKNLDMKGTCFRNTLLMEQFFFKKRSAFFFLYAEILLDMEVANLISILYSMMESNNIQTEEALDAFIQCDDYIKSDLSYDFWTPQFKQMVIENREKFQEMRDLKFDDYTPSIYEVKQEASNQDSNNRTNDKRFTAKLIEFENEFEGRSENEALEKLKQDFDRHGKEWIVFKLFHYSPPE